jgi:hypothetical protein
VGGAGAAVWNGTFPIYDVTGSQFKYYLTALPDAAAALDANSTAAKVLAFPLDDVLNALPANLHVHLGPTPAGQPFLTRGYADGVSGGWQPKPGQKISGAGVDVTVLKLVPTAWPGAHFFVIGHALTAGDPAGPNLLDFLEVSDLTIDCNLSIPPGTAVACGGVRLMGNHARIRRVKAVQWGTNAVARPCFVLAGITGETSAGLGECVDIGIEECIVVQPAASVSDGVVTALHVGGQEGAGNAAEAYGKGPFIRRCFVDGGSPAAAVEYRGLSMGWCRGGLVEGNQVHNVRYGGPYQEQTSALDVIVRDNFYKNVAKGPYWKLGQLSEQSIGGGSLTVTGGVATVTLNASHHLAVGERVQIGGSPNVHDGIHVLSAVPSSTSFCFNTAQTADATVEWVKKVFGVGRLIVERNTIELATGSTGQVAIHVDDAGLALQPPDYVHGDVLVRENKIRYTDGQFDAAFDGRGLEVNGAKHVIVGQNVVECAPANPLRNARCGAATYFHNTTPAGALIQGFDGTVKYSELETEAEDALVAALI